MLLYMHREVNLWAGVSHESHQQYTTGIYQELDNFLFLPLLLLLYMHVQLPSNVINCIIVDLPIK